MNSDKINRILNIVFSQPPSAVGMRLSSERKLAKLFEEPQTNIHKILDEFVTKGILVRRHGSGTFIHKVSTLKRYQNDELYEEAKSLAFEILCVNPSGRKMAKRHLKLSLWSDFVDTTNTNNLIAESICKRAEELGHSIVMRSLVKKISTPLDIEDVVEEIKKTPHDGYIVVARWGKLFQLALSMALQSEHPPICYLMPCSYYIECEPYITLDTNDVIRRTVRLFAAEGYSCIGMLQLREQNFLLAKENVHVFKSEMDLFGLQAVTHDLPLADCNIEDVRSAVDHFLEHKVEALYVADDHIVQLLSQVFDEKSMVPGRDIAVITIANKGVTLPESFEWSRFEFDLDSFGKTIVDSLLTVISTAGENMLSFSHKAIWRPGKTHSNLSN
jgi:DNA-binding LacI/PurR family transcriptional regulator